MWVCKKIKIVFLLIQITGISTDSRRFLERMKYLQSRINAEANFRNDENTEIMNKLNDIEERLKMSLDNEIDVVHEEKGAINMYEKYIQKLKTDFSSIRRVFRKEKAATIRFRRQLPAVEMNSEALKKDVGRYCSLKQNNTDYLVSYVKKLEDIEMDMYINMSTSTRCSSFKNISEHLQENVNFDTEKLERSFENIIKNIENTLNNSVEEVSQRHETLVKKIENNNLSIFKIMGLFTKILDSVTLCNIPNKSGGEWIVFQRRQDGAVNFYRNWSEYKRGFGNLNGEFWLGNDMLSILTANGDKELRIELEDFDGSRAYAQYRSFKIYPEKEKYRLEVNGYKGTAGDGLNWINGMPFSTFDNDNDEYSRNCAEDRNGAWWYKACSYSNLNGRYYKDGKSFPDAGVAWWKWEGHHSLKRTEMKFR